MLYVSVLYIVFGVFLNRGEPSFFLFLLCGQVPFLWFSKSVSNSSMSIVSGKNLINQVYLPKAIFPLWTVTQDFAKQIVVIFGLIIVLLVNEVSIGVSWFSIPILMIVQFTVIIASSLVVSFVVPFIPDFRLLVGTFLMMLMFGSGIFYSYSSVILPEHQKLFLFNPMANLIKNYRVVFLESQWPDFNALMYIFAISLSISFVMLWVFKCKDSALARAVL